VSTFLVRKAVTADAAGIARVHIQAWRETYSRLVEPGELDALDADARAERWSGILGEGRSLAWVAVVEDVVVGFAATGTFRQHDRPRPVELEALYLLTEQHGSGAGQALLEAAIGDAPAFLFVAADNPRAARFYERNGFVADGVTENHPLVRTPVLALRMVR
jgi:GNAT superfamily N-acetyltransferase